MSRWDPGASDRLRDAALDLSLERGFENVTATDIAVRAGLTRRTFFRHFGDTREVLFGGAERLPGVLRQHVASADSSLSPFETALDALTRLGVLLTRHADRSQDRRTVIAASPSLLERERTKHAALASALVDGLSARGSNAPELLAQVAVSVFATAFGQWVDDAGREEFPDVFRDAVVTIRSSIGPLSS